jgi:hypothetical protein
MKSMLLTRLALLALVTLAFTSCQMNDAAMQAMMDQRNAAIAAEPAGDYYIGRRFHIDRTHLWGYVRKARQPWDTSKLVIMNERSARTPDRIPEEPSGGGQAFGYDHNAEYRIWGHFTGRRIYDPNSDLAIPEFEATKFQLINASPGWLFKPNERFNGSQLLRAEPGTTP